MKKIEAFIGQEVLWVVRKVDKREYSLEFNGESVANISWQKFLKPAVIIKTIEANWIIEKVGKFFDSKYSVRLADSDGEFARINLKRNAIIELSDGKKFYWTKQKGERGKYVLQDEAGKQNIRFNYIRASLFRNNRKFFIDQNITNYVQGSFLVLISAYIIYACENRETAIAMAAIAGA